MFINPKRLVKYMEKSFKNAGLSIGYIDGKFIINDNFIAVSLEEDYTNNTIRAAIVNYLGNLPKNNCYYFVQKNLDAPQLKMSEADAILAHLHEFWIAEKKAYATPLTYEGLRLLQDTDGNVFGILAGYLDIIDKSMIDYGNESEPIGPCYIAHPDGGVYWHNDYCTMIIAPTKIAKEDMLKVLSQLDYYKKDEKHAAEAQ